MQARTVASHRDDALVALRKGIGNGVGEARAKIIAALLGAVDLQDRKGARLNRFPRVLIEGFGDLPVLRIVLPHKPLVLPLPLRAVAKEENGGIGPGRLDGKSVAVRRALRRTKKGKRANARRSSF